MKVTDALSNLQTVIAKNEGKHLLNYGELRELTNAQNDLLIAIAQEIGVNNE